MFSRAKIVRSFNSVFLVLSGGLSEFHARFEDLCIKSKPTPTTPLYSPTTPTLVSSDIDNAVASKILPFLYIGQSVHVIWKQISQHRDLLEQNLNSFDIFNQTGNERDASNRERLRELGITHILNVTPNVACCFEDEQCDDKLVYKRLQATDCGNQNLKQYFQEAAAFIGASPPPPLS